jgi:cytidine deaminase
MSEPRLQPVTSAEITALTAAARRAASNAYAPYSHFFVGAALLLESGETITGCNVENASYRLTTCAEQTAIAAAVAQLGPGIRVRAVAVQNLADALCSPCGACRQTLAEFAPPDAPILFPGDGGRNTTRTLAELLPATFSLDKAAV